MIHPVTSTDPLNILQIGLDSLSAQHRVIANNMANIDTPNFKRSVVSFQDKLAAALRVEDPSPLWRTHPNHFPIAKQISLDGFEPDVRTVTETTGRNDGNNVDLEMESALLAQNTLLYNSTADVMGRYMAGLRHAISEGRQ